MEQKKMNPKVKREWLTALRSGDYIQGTGCLKSYDRELEVDTYCCLGVLCDIAQKHGVGNWEDVRFVVGDENRWGVLPDAIQEWSGLDSETGVYERGTLSLTNKNDRGASFEQIADIIEAEF